MSKFTKDEFVKWNIGQDQTWEMVVVSQRKKDKEGKTLTDGPWWVIHVPGKPKLVAVVHEDKLERV